MADVTGFSFTGKIDATSQKMIVKSQGQFQLKANAPTGKSGGLRVSSGPEGELKMEALSFTGERAEKYRETNAIEDFSVINPADFGQGIEINGSVELGDITAPKDAAGKPLSLTLKGTDGDDVFILSGQIEGFSKENPLKIEGGKGNDTVIFKSGTTAISEESLNPEADANTPDPSVISIDLGLGQDRVLNRNGGRFKTMVIDPDGVEFDNAKY
jgi:hypothetical protein